MILDVTLEQNAYLLKIHKSFFENKTFPMSLFKADIPLMNKYLNLGEFHTSKLTFGFAGCFQFEREEADYLIYRFNFPEIVNIEIRRMLLTIYLATNYVVEQMFYYKEFFLEPIWDDQSLTFVIFNGGQSMGGYSIGGQIYPWFKNSLNGLSNDKLIELNEYVLLELNRVSNYFFKRNASYAQVTLSKESFFIQVSSGGRWIDWRRNCSSNKPEEFSSHSIDYSSDQKLCFAAIVAINTWLRNN